MLNKPHASLYVQSDVSCTLVQKGNYIFNKIQKGFPFGYLHTHTHAHTHRHTHVHTQAHMHGYTHRHTHTYTHTCTGTHTGTPTQAHPHTQAHRHTRMHTHTHAHRHTHMHTHTHTGTHACTPTPTPTRTHAHPPHTHIRACALYCVSMPTQQIHCTYITAQLIGVPCSAGYRGQQNTRVEYGNGGRGITAYLDSMEELVGG